MVFVRKDLFSIQCQMKLYQLALFFELCSLISINLQILDVVIIYKDYILVITGECFFAIYALFMTKERLFIK
jgi:hypothetical protein